MKTILKKYLTVIISVFILMQLINSVKIGGGLEGVLIASLLLGVLVFLVNPVLQIITLPLNILTLNFVSWIIYVLLIYVWTIIAGVKIGPWAFKGFRFGSLTLSPFLFSAWQTLIVSGIVFTLIFKFIGWILD